MRKLFVVFAVMLSAGASLAQTKVGSVDSQALLDSMPSYLEAQRTIEQIRMSAMEELQTLQVAFEKAYKKYIETEKEMAPVVRDLEQKKLSQKDQEIQQKQQSLQSDLQRIAQQLNEPILKMVQDAVNNVAKANKYDAVIDQSMLLYFNGVYDITDKVAEELKKLEAAN